MSTFSKTLVKLRKERNMTQAELSKKLGLCPSSIANFESGLREPGLKHLVKLGEIFDVDMNYLINGKDTSEIARYLDVEIRRASEDTLEMLMLYQQSTPEFRKLSRLALIAGQHME